MRETTYVSTPATGYALPLSLAKQHLRVSDTTPGVSASVTLGTGASQLIISHKLDGEVGNDFSVIIVEDGTSTPLSATLSDGLLTINLATDSGGAATSTVNDVIAYILNDTELSAVFSATSGVGNGTGLLAAASETALSGGIDGTGDDDSYILTLCKVAEEAAENYLRRKLITQTVTYAAEGFPASQFLELSQGPIQSVSFVKYYDTDGVLQTFDAANYTARTDTIPEYLELNSDASWPVYQSYNSRAVQVQWVAGYGDSYTDLPKRILQSLMLMVGNWYSNREHVLVGASSAMVLPRGVEWLLFPLRDMRF